MYITICDVVTAFVIGVRRQEIENQVLKALSTYMVNVTIMPTIDSNAPKMT